jgi:Cellulase (glycosyl hydrolase family 5)/Glycoside hydrolase family 5 C-terminal domain
MAISRRVGGLSVALSVGVLASFAFVPTAPALPNRCGTQPPERSPTWVDALGSHWFDEHGLWTQGPDGSIFGQGGVDADGQSVQADLLADHSTQASVSADRQCVVSGDVSAGAPVVGEFPVKAAPAIVPLPWLRRDGALFRASDGRTTILRGVDYPYNEEPFEPPYNLTDRDFARIASWGLNLLRIRLSGVRSGYVPDHPPEPGYLEHLDHLIADANRDGIYVLLSTVTGDVESQHLLDQTNERVKFIDGTRDHAWWMDFQAAIFRRYRDWPGVVGFDTINEDDSYPPYVADQHFIGPAHREIDAILRRSDPRHVYFQEPSGWSYWNAEYWPGMMSGADLGDPNRFYCPKWKVGADPAGVLDVKDQLAVESNAPMFICEFWIDKGTAGDYTDVMARQREALNAMDQRLLGAVRVLYGPSDGYGTFLSDGTEAPWVQEFARPYPRWAGGTITSIAFDFDARVLRTAFDLDGSGPTEIFVPQGRMYRNGFVASASTGARLVCRGSGVLEAHGLSWDAARQMLVAPAQVGRAVITVAPL